MRRFGQSAILLPLLLSAAAAGQQIEFEPNPFTAPDRITPVDMGFADVNPLATPLLRVHNDTRLDTNFEQVYALPGGGFARQAGAIRATFNESNYVRDRRSGRVSAPIPAGTVFEIGPQPVSTPLQSPRRQFSASAVSQRVDVSRPAIRLARPARDVETVIGRAPDRPIERVSPMLNERTRAERLYAITTRVLEEG
ncbi:MAG: hypothetical protein AAGD00_06345 [Planctomycetota bacterium]